MEASYRRTLANWATSRAPARLLGYTAEGMPVTLSEEERENHIHVLGSPGEGKSKFIEMLVRGDVERGYGACLIDPGERGDTALRLLKWCCARGFEKVLYVDPTRWYRRLPVMQPLHHSAFHTEPVSGVMDALRILWDSRDVETPRIQRFLPAVLHALHASRLTLADVHWFMSRDVPRSPVRAAQERILDALPPLSAHRRYLEEALHGSLMEYRDFKSTINRLDPLTDPTLRPFLGSLMPPIPWADIVADGWLVLVSLDGQRLWGPETIHTRLVGTLVVNEINRAISAAFRRSQGANVRPFYVYIDEAGRFMTPKIKDALDLKRKTPMKLTLSHQYFDQVEDRAILASIRASAKTKVLFNTSNRADRELMLRDMNYGGMLSDREVAHSLGGLKKQVAAVRIGKAEPRFTELADVPDARASPNAIKSFMERICSYEWFHDRKDVEEEINARFSSTSSWSGGRRDKKGDRPAGARERPLRDRPAAGFAVPAEPERKTHFDD